MVSNGLTSTSQMRQFRRKVRHSHTPNNEHGHPFVFVSGLIKALTKQLNKWFSLVYANNHLFFEVLSLTESDYVPCFISSMDKRHGYFRIQENSLKKI